MAIHCLLDRSLTLETRHFFLDEEQASIPLSEVATGEVFAVVDNLTGACNRLKLDAVLDKLQARAHHYGRAVSIILFELDHFKQVNDRHGHPVGDEVLRRFADLVRRTIRDTDIFGRWSGEEFMLIYPESARADAAQLAERIRQAFSELELPSGRQTLSADVAEWRAGQSVEAWINLCDQRLYRAKPNGRNQLVCAP